MATTVTDKWEYPYKPGYYLELTVTRKSISGNTEDFSWTLKAINTTTGYSYDLYQYAWGVTINGQTWTGTHDFDFRSTDTNSISSGTTKYFTANSNGDLEVVFSAYHGSGSDFGKASGSSQFWPDSLGYPPKTPAAPTLYGSKQLTTLTFQGTMPDANPDPSSYYWQVATNSSFTSIAKTYSGTDLTPTFTGLSPSTDYWVRYRATNSKGTSSYSSALATSTLKSVPDTPSAPSILSKTVTSLTFKGVAPNDNGATITSYTWYLYDGATQVAKVSGTSLTQTFSGLTPNHSYSSYFTATSANGTSSPSASTSATTNQALPPSSFSVTPDPIGDAATINVTLGSVQQPTYYSIQATSSSDEVGPTRYSSAPFTVDGLTPGNTYSWSIASVYVDGANTWTSAYSPIQTVAQPSPNTSPGSFFSGATASTSQITYAWTGTAHASTSTASMSVPTNWSASTSSPGSVVLVRSTGGHTRTYCARAVILTDTVATVVVGPNSNSKAAVSSGSSYWGSAWVRADRDQAMQATIQWLDSSNNVISTSYGAAVTCPKATWTRVTVNDVAPANAVGALVKAQDSTGSAGYSKWLSGEGFNVDDAMITLGDLLPYYDGGTPDDAYFQYDWSGTPEASTSARTTLQSQYIDPLADPTVAAVPTAPRPPIVLDDSVTVIGDWMRTWMSIPASLVSQWKDVVPTFELVTGDSDTRQIRIRIFENPDDLDPSQIDSDSWLTAQTISYIPANSTITLDGVSERVWAELPDGSTIAADKLLYGSKGEPPEWPILSCGQNYLLAVDVPTTAPQGNLMVNVSMTRRA